MRLRIRSIGGPLAYRVPTRRPLTRETRDMTRPSDPVRLVAIVTGAVLAALACIAFAPDAGAAPVAAPVTAPVIMPRASAPVASAPLAATAPRYALVLQDAVPLRASPKAGGAPLASLGQGELVEVRGERMDYLQVWDLGRERGGFVRASALRPLSMSAGEAPELLALLRFLRDRPGSEALGLGFAAAYLKAAPAGTITAEAFDAMGTLAERLAWRANAASAATTRSPASPAGEPAVTAQLEVAAGLGVRFESIEREGGVVLCYDGDAFRRVLALSPTPEQAARAALALTRHDCIDPMLPPPLRWQADQARAALLDRVPTAGLAPYWRNRLRMRQAGVWAALAFEDGRRVVVEAGGPPPALPAVTAADVLRAGNAALDALAAVDKAELADDDQSTWTDAAMRVGASRWAAEPAPAAPASASLGIVTQPGERGETCVLLVDAKHPATSPLARRCTWGLVWTASARADATQGALALAVQPLDTWRELWVFRKTADGWTTQVLPPSTDAVDVGYVEFAGWVPSTGQLLAAREVRDPARGNRPARSYELLDGTTLATLRKADAPSSLSSFARWQDAAWKRTTVSLR